MPCCTLLAFVLSQIGLGAGAMKTRFAGKVPFALGGWKALGLAAIAGAEIVLASAALPLIFTAHDRADAAQSLHHAWRICSVDLAQFDDQTRKAPAAR